MSARFINPAQQIRSYFAGGDAVTGPDTVIAAIGAGHQAADDIDAAIRKANNEPAL